MTPAELAKDNVMKLICFFLSHKWNKVRRRDGWNSPVDGAVCLRCGIVCNNELRI